MGDLLVLFISLTVFGVGATIVDFLGILDNSSEGGEQGDDTQVGKGSNLAKTGEKPESRSEASSFKVVSTIMNVLRNAVYFSLGFGPTGLFAALSGLSKTSGLLWALGFGVAMIFLAGFIKKLIRRDTDSTIKPNELLQEKGTLLLPLAGEEISKAVVHQYGREIEIYVRSSDKDCKLSKGKDIIIEEYDNDIYWVKPAED